MPAVENCRYRKSQPPFGRWLLAQRERTDAVGRLAQAAAIDNSFPRDGDWNAVSRRLAEAGADGDLHQALEDAELDYLCW